MANSSQGGSLRRHPVFFVGLDLGKNQDHSSLAVIERRELVFPERDPVTIEFRREVWNVLRRLQRVPLHTPYPDVVELVRQAKLSWSLVPVTITSGDGETSDAKGYGVPKRDLIVGLQVVFQKLASG